MRLHALSQKITRQSLTADAADDVVILTQSKTELDTKRCSLALYKFCDVQRESIFLQNLKTINKKQVYCGDCRPRPGPGVVEITPLTEEQRTEIGDHKLYSVYQRCECASCKEFTLPEIMNTTIHSSQHNNGEQIFAVPVLEKLFIILKLSTHLKRKTLSLTFFMDR